MNYLYQLWGWLNGKKTYVAALFMIAQGLLVDGWQNGDWNEAVVKLQAGLAVFGFRHAINKG